MKSTAHVLEVGQRFSRLTVKEVTQVRKGSSNATAWLCACDCGNEVRAFSYDLRRGKVTSCGCANQARLQKGKQAVHDLTGQKFGRLTVLEHVGYVWSKSGAYKKQAWRCRCDCGLEKTLATGELTTGNTRSCGCLQRDQACSATMYSAANRIRFDILRDGGLIEMTDDEVVNVIRQDRFYCGAKPRKDSRYAKVFRNGMDRKQPKGNYTVENVVPCCRRCNVAKNDRTLEEFVAHIKQTYFHLINKGF